MDPLGTSRTRRTETGRDARQSQDASAPRSAGRSGQILPVGFRTSAKRGEKNRHFTKFDLCLGSDEASDDRACEFGCFKPDHDASVDEDERWIGVPLGEATLCRTHETEVDSQTRSSCPARRSAIASTQGSRSGRRCDLDGVPAAEDRDRGNANRRGTRSSDRRNMGTSDRVQRRYRSVRRVPPEVDDDGLRSTDGRSPTRILMACVTSSDATSEVSEPRTPTDWRSPLCRSAAVREEAAEARRRGLFIRQNRRAHALAADRRAVDVWHRSHDREVVQQVAGLKVVEPVDDHVRTFDVAFGVLRGEKSS